MTTVDEKTTEVAPRKLDFTRALGENIEELWERVVDVQKKVFGVTWPRNKDGLTQKYIQLLQEECSEVLRTTDFKPHKKPTRIESEREEERASEIADLLIYLLALAAVHWESASEFIAWAMVKMDENDGKGDW